MPSKLIDQMTDELQDEINSVGDTKHFEKCETVITEA